MESRASPVARARISEQNYACSQLALLNPLLADLPYRAGGFVTEIRRIDATLVSSYRQDRSSRRAEAAAKYWHASKETLVKILTIIVFLTFTFMFTMFPENNGR